MGFFTRLSRPTLVSIVLFLGGLASTAAGAWIKRVEGHITQADSGLDRLTRVEATSAGNAQEVKELREEVREFRKEFFDSQRWMAQQVGDIRRQREMEERIRELEKEKQGAAKP